MFRKLKITYLSRVTQNFSTRVQIDATLRPGFESNEYKPRSHPGRIRTKPVSLPEDIQKTIQIVLDDAGARSLYQESQKLSDYLSSRLLPPEQSQIDNKASKIHQSVSKTVYSKVKNKELSDMEREDYEKLIKVKVFNILKKNLYRWGNISFDAPTCQQYLMSRAAPEYAVLYYIFDEIRRRHPDFKPRSFLDFGSGVGTGTWAVNSFWKGDIFEYFCIDTSAEMNELARLILCKGVENSELPLRGFFQRQFLPASTELKYNIVLSAFTLFEMPDMQSRLQTIQKLWNKTEDYLIIVEQGSNSGFEIINEAREFILNLPKGPNSGYAFAPCPNDAVCPRYLEGKTPCNFIMKFEPLPYPHKKETAAELFSYVVLRKGERPENDPQWPRVVRAPIVRSKHTICRMCTSQGELEDIIFSKGKYDQSTYRCARSSNWGDLLPVK